MKRFLFVLGLCLMGAGLAFVAPAEAVLTACGEFTFIAKDRIAFEQGATVVSGNVLVTNPTTGIVIVGNHVTINGTVTAHKITLGTGAVVAKCVADIVTGPGTCTVREFAFPGDAAACLGYPLTDPVVVDDCVLTAPALNILNDTVQPPLPNCFGALKVADGKTLELTGSSYNFKTIFLGSGSTLLGNGPGPVPPLGTTEVNVKGLFTTENAVSLTNLRINSAQSVGEAHIGHGSIVTNTVFNIPSGTLHIHTGTRMLDCSEAVGRRLEIQPVTTTCDISLICVCPLGSEFTQGDKDNPLLNRQCCVTGSANCPNP